MKPTKTRVKVDASVLFIAVVTLVSLSAIIASLIGTSKISLSSLNFSAKPSPSTYGWCVTNINIFGMEGGKRMTKGDCAKRDTDDDPNTKWYAFCADVTGQPERDADNCKLNYKFNNGALAPFQASLRLAELMLRRDELIERINDGQLTPEDIALQWEFTIPVRLDTVCGVYSAGNAPSNPNSATNKITLMSAEYTGHFDLAKKANILFSKMAKMENDCRVLPDSCLIKGVHSNHGSNHPTGKAIDFCCSENMSSCDMATIDALLNRIKQADSDADFTIIRECTAKERGGPTDSQRCPKPNATTGCEGGLLHIDLTHPAPFIQTNCNSVPR
jgi:hypothetical protein